MLEGGLRPRLQAHVAELFKGRHGSFFANPNFSLCKRCLVRRFHLTGQPCHCPTSWPPAPSGLATALRSAAELAPFLHPADEFLLAPRLLAGLGALAAQETCCLVQICHG